MELLERMNRTLIRWMLELVARASFTNNFLGRACYVKYGYCYIFNRDRIVMWPYSSSSSMAAKWLDQGCFLPIQRQRHFLKSSKPFKTPENEAYFYWHSEDTPEI
ncbi:hypothetical protein Tco_0199656 [Tanacetum coccineum]